MRISDWSSDVCSSDLLRAATSPWLRHGEDQFVALRPRFGAGKPCAMLPSRTRTEIVNIHASCVAAGNGGVLILGNSGQGKSDLALRLIDRGARLVADDRCDIWFERGRSEGHTSELQSLMRISYAVFCLNKKKIQQDNTN